MTNITETPAWAPVVDEIDITDQVLGGPDGVINIQAKQLADRTAYLKQQVETAGATAGQADTKADQALAQIDAIEIASGAAADNAMAALTHKQAAQAAQALAEQARNAAQAASAQAGDNASYAAEAAGTAQLKAAEAQSGATAAVSASGSALAHRTAAETARGLAQAAQTGAEAAQTGAQSAMSLADAARIASESASGAAAGSATAADADRIAADASAAAAASTVASLQAAGGAALVGNTPAGGLSATTVQAAINELDSEKVANTNLAASSGASLVGGTWFGGIVATVAALATSVGASLLGFIQAGVGSVLRSIQDKLRERVSVLDFGAVGDGVADDTAAIQTAINYLNQTNFGGILYFPRGVYKTTLMLTVPWTGSGIIFQGEGGVDQSGDGVSTILGEHLGDAVLSLQGSVTCRINDLSLAGSTGATYPKTGLLLGRNGPGSAGWHVFDRLCTFGRFSVAAHYNVASEGNTYRDCWFSLNEDAPAPRVIYLSGADGGGLNPVTPLTGSTLLGLEFLNCHIYHMSLAAGVSCIDINGSVVVGSIAFRGGYLVQANGHFVSISNGFTDGKDTLGPLTFDGVGGERPGGVGVPISGFNLYAHAGAPVYLRGLHINNCTFLMAAGNYIKQDQYVRLANAVILSQGINGADTASLTFPSSVIGPQRFGLSSVNAGECLNCLIDVGGGFRVEGTNQVTFTGTWNQTFSTGNGFGPVGYYKDMTGHVHLTGAPIGGDSGTSVFTLPVGYRPSVSKAFSCVSNASILAGVGDTRVDVGIDGTVTVTGGTSPVFLNSIVFPTFA